MPVISPSDSFLANITVNANRIGNNYMVWLSQNIPQYGVRSHRFIILDLYNANHGTFQEMLVCAESIVLNSCRNLTGNEGLSVMSEASNYLTNKFESGENPIISPFIQNLKIFGHPKSNLVLFGQKYYPKQRVYLQELTDTMEILAAIRYNNQVLINDPNVNFRQRLQIGSPLLHPGKSCVSSAYILRNLKCLKNLELDLKDAEAVEGFMNVPDYEVHGAEKY